MAPGVQEEKITQAAAYLVQKRGQGFISYMKLIKLLYLTDREALKRWGRPVTFDRFSAMPHGMVLSGTLDLITGEELGTVWNKAFEAHGDHEIKLKATQQTGMLSRAELKLLDEIFEQFGKMSRWDIADFTHSLPEYVDPNGSSIPVRVSDVLKFGDKTPAEIESIVSELESLSALSALTQP